MTVTRIERDDGRTLEPGPEETQQLEVCRPTRPTFAQRIRTYAPAIGFFGGFLWDAITLQRSITSLDLFLLLAYWLGAATILVLLGRKVSWKISPYLNFVLQFFIGGIFSALVIFYFLSSSHFPGFVVVLLLTVLLVGNEFLEKRYEGLALAWTMFSVAGIMFFNFALPHLFRSLHPAWFYISTALALSLVFVLRRVSREKWVSLAPPAIAAALLVVLHLTNVIPPVPLVQKRMVIAHDVDRRGSDYILRLEGRGVSRFRWISGPDVHLQPGARLYCFTAVFLPPGIETTIQHRWQHLTDDGAWETISTVPFDIAGGRKEGYRGYTYKTNPAPGRWRVLTESASSGATIGVTRFRVVRGEPRRTREARF